MTRNAVNRGALATLIAVSLLGATSANAAPSRLAIGSLGGTSDLSGLSGSLENGLPANVLGGLGSGLAWAGGDTFLALPDRGPNATTYTGGAAVDNTTSYIARFNTVTLGLSAAASGAPLPYTLTPSLNSTTLFYSSTPLSYGSTAGLPSGAPTINTSSKSYFTGRSDGFGAGNSLNPNNARLDPESIRVSRDGHSVFVSDEYGLYVYQFDRATGARIKTFTLPANLAIANQSAIGATEISGNTSGRVANKGMEGLAITPDGKTLVGFIQSPLIQDGGDGGRANRIVTINIATGETHEYAYDNKIGSKAFNSSEIIAINDHEFLVDERDGKGKGDGTSAVVKQLYRVNITGATDVTNISGEANLLAVAVPKTLVADVKAVLNAAGVADTDIPAKLEGLAFGQDVTVNNQLLHTLYVTNDNDFVPGVAGPNNFYVIGLSDADLPGFVNQSIDAVAPVPLPGALCMFAPALAGLAAFRRRRSSIVAA